MVTQTTSVDLTAPQVDEAGAVLGRAFWDDPAAVYILPDDGARLEPLSRFMTAAARYASLFGSPDTTGGKVEAAGLWLPPGEWDMPEEQMGKAELDPLAILGADANGRFENMFGHLHELHVRDVAEPHWYLFILGVDPPRQGQGVGSTIIQRGIARADAAGLPCYLETMKTRNVPFYQKHGFEVVVEDDIPDSSLHFWTMKRPAQK